MKELQSFIHSKIAMLDNDTPYSRASCAKLRRAVGKAPEECPDVWEITLPNAPAGRRCGDVIHTVLTLYALHRQGKDESMSDGVTGFGEAVAKLIKPHDEGDNEASIRRRFNAVATSVEFSELAHHARGLVQMLRANGIKMNYPAFANDLYYFQFPEQVDKIRLSWGKGFYRVNTNNTYTSTDTQNPERTDDQ